MADSETETQRRRKRAKFIYLKFICVTRFCLFWPNKNIDDYLMLCVPCFANLYLQNCLLKGLDFMSCIFYSWTGCYVKMCIERTFNIVSRVIIMEKKCRESGQRFTFNCIKYTATTKTQRLGKCISSRMVKRIKKVQGRLLNE